MPIFKYYRPNIYFEKAIRYNEIYFSANHELNDPNDLKATYYFEDNPALWKKLLALDTSKSLGYLQLKRLKPIGWLPLTKIQQILGKESFIMGRIL